MIIHTADSRGKADHGWLKSSHSFSFADYYDPTRMGFGTLRVINDDYVAPGMGFGTHPHRDMEIVTIPLTGALAHKDSMGNASTISKGEAQIMSAGTGITHSEFNASKTEPVTLLQIWVLPKVLKVTPRYEQKVFRIEERKDKWQTVVAPDGRDGAVGINQNAFFSLAQLSASSTLTYDRKTGGNGMYLFVIEGEVEALGKKLNKRDAMGIEDLDRLEIKSEVWAEVLLIEMPM